jgi:hypothetical protein
MVRNLNAQPVDLKSGAMKYEKARDKYIEVGPDRRYLYQPEDKMVFPRVWMQVTTRITQITMPIS